jgi:putative ABC transport system permease protein
VGTVNKFYEKGFFFADSTVFKVFSFELVEGDPDNALKEPFTVVISESAAKRYFGNEDPFGKTIRADNAYDFRITGIMKDIPRTTHFKCDFFASWITLDRNFNLYGDLRQSWIDHRIYNYLLLEKGTAENFEQKLSSFIEKYLGTQMRQFGVELFPYLRPVTDIHLHSNILGEIEPNSSISYIYIFSVVGFFILIIACINFMNLSTARSSTRAREISMRKVAGAYKSQLFKQFLTESVFLAFLALLIALIFVYLAIPVFSNLSGKELKIGDLDILTWCIILILMTAFVGLISGSYPSLFLARFNPVEVLKGRLQSGSSKSILRKILVIFQFTISGILLISTIIVFNQLNYIKDRDLGFNEKNIITLPLSDPALRSRYRALKDQLQQNPNIMTVSASSIKPGGFPNLPVLRPEGFGPDETWPMNAAVVDYNYIELLDMKNAEGRNFSIEFAADTINSAIINETALNEFGWDSGINKFLQYSGGNFRLNIVGVLKDFHFKSFHERIDPFLFRLGRPDNFQWAFIKISSADIQQTVNFIKTKWDLINPAYPFEYSFLDNDIEELYRAEIRMGNIFIYFTFLAVFIACLGLFGLVSFTAQQRTKEIGIRKVLGATVQNIVLIISKDFIFLVLISNIFAWPAAYYILNKWLQNFAYRVDIGIFAFVISTLLALIIAFATVSFQSVKSAYSDPVDSLKYE